MSKTQIHVRAEASTPSLDPDALAETLHANPNYPCDCGHWPCERYVGAYWADQAYEFIAGYEVMVR